jgi:hypothetical protein
MSRLTTAPTRIRYGPWWVKFVVAAIASWLTIFFAIHHSPRNPGWWFAMAFTVSLTLFGILPSQTEFDIDGRMIQRRWKLLGLVTVFRRRQAMREFRQVCWVRVPGCEPRDLDSWMVGFERNSGRRVFVNYFQATEGSPPEEARHFAIMLSQMTGLPLSTEIQHAV